MNDALASRSRKVKYPVNNTKFIENVASDPSHRLFAYDIASESENLAALVLQLVESTELRSQCFLYL